MTNGNVVHVPSGACVMNTYTNPDGSSVMTISQNGSYQTFNVPNVPIYTLPYGTPWSHPAPTSTPAKNADELLDGDLILALVARGYAVWKPNPEGK